MNKISDADVMQPICTHKISVQSSNPSHACRLWWLECELRKTLLSAPILHSAITQRKQKKGGQEC